ncbi:MAG: DNA polymerase I, partial [Parcubacteria group bacterium]|nr:DNA polymerase I [Parcubacteria group bacterium]
PEAKEFFRAYFDEFPGIRGYLEASRAEASSRGYATTFFGRRRQLPELTEGGWQSRQAALRMAVNMPIQGTEADLVKLAMIRIHAKLRISSSLRDSVRLLLQVHDELLFEVAETEVEHAIARIKPIMEQVFPELPVSLVVDVKTGERWGSLVPRKT